MLHSYSSIEPSESDDPLASNSTDSGAVPDVRDAAMSADGGSLDSDSDSPVEPPSDPSSSSLLSVLS